MRSTLVLSSLACSLAFTFPSVAMLTTTLSAHQSHHSRGPSLDMSLASSSSIDGNDDEWTSGLVYSQRPSAQQRQKGQKGKRRFSKQGRGSALAVAISTSGGSDAAPSPEGKRTALGLLASAWGSLGVMYILLKPLKRLLPVAVLPFAGLSGGVVADPSHALGSLGWASYALFVGFMGYAEGFKGFQSKFSPMVVARATTLESGPGRVGTLGSLAAWFFKALLAPLYSMGLFHASKKRLIVSWSMVVGIGAIVALCKRAPLPARCIIDGGVVVGLGWGAAAVFANYVKSLVSGAPPSGVDPCMPTPA